MASPAHPTTADEIVDLIRDVRNGHHLASREQAVDLVEQYAAVVASGAAITAAKESFDKCPAAADAALAKTLVVAPAERAVP